MPDENPLSLTFTPESEPESPGIEPDLTLRHAGLGLETTPDLTGSERDLEGTPPADYRVLAPLTSQPPVADLVRSPHLSDRQFIWVTYRLSTMDDLEACSAAQVPVDEVLAWRENPQFNEFLEGALRDKNKTFRDLTSHLLPETGRVIYRLLTSTRLGEQAKGAQLLLRHQGLFLDRVEVTDQAAIASLLEKLRAPSPVEILDVTPRP